MDHKYIVVGVDGTGSASWMKKDGSNSHTFKFIHDIKYGSIGSDRLYLHGPSNKITGSDAEPITQKAIDFIYHRLGVLFPGLLAKKIKPFDLYDVNQCMQDRARSNQTSYVFLSQPMRLPQRVTSQMLAHQPLTTNDVRIVLIGHSRGGLVVTNVARMLSPLVRVYFMGLYDSVDRQGCLDGMNVENVKYVAHARRNPEVGSRYTFSNTSLNYIGVDHAEEMKFYTSHGGIGGDFVRKAEEVGFGGDSSCVPNTTVYTEFGQYNVPKNPQLVKKFGKPMDAICTDGKYAADAFMRAQARKYGIPIG
jgi:hypothetical protein